MQLDSVFYNLILKHNISYEDMNYEVNNLNVLYIDYADLYFQVISCEYITFSRNIVKKISYFEDSGISARSILDKKVNFIYSNGISLKKLRYLVKSIVNMHVVKKNVSCIDIIYNKNQNNNFIYKNYLQKCYFLEKLEILHMINKLARNIDKRVFNVIISMFIKYEQVLVTSTNKNISTDVRPFICIKIIVFSEENSIVSTGSCGGKLNNVNNLFSDIIKCENNIIKKWSRKAVKSSLINLKAKCAPSGSFPVILGSGLPGILLHEAIGHGLEGDFSRKNISIYSNKIGQKIASNLCTIVDNGTFLHGAGTSNIDDEGVNTRFNILIKDGILCKYLQDMYNSMLTKSDLTGNARRESYKFIPYPRMTNTYMLNGTTDPKDIINSVKYGIYAVNFSGGQVDIVSGNFVFNSSRAYLIQNGKITYPIKDIAFIGSALNVMKNISMVGNDFRIDDGLGVCVKENQEVHVGVGQPTIKIEHITVGGSV
ncbi:metallopeptidase TldD-related protein [Buchnera aphidicola (Chaitoregma tattakana)]|uniref:metallopeptidase TldD-related protein n=1 Tax=Buchnera aphidicola TaxID=9 RepID=UPI0031B7FA3E